MAIVVAVVGVKDEVRVRQGTGKPTRNKYIGATASDNVD